MGRSVQHIKVIDPHTNVYDAARGRIAQLFDRFEHIIVDFSGGKDSTIVLHLALDEARRRHQCLDVLFSDEEAVDPDTLTYLETVAAWPDVHFLWCCAPIQHTLQSHGRPFWTCWDRSQEDVWIRPPPSNAVLTHPTWDKDLTINAWSDCFFPTSQPHTTCHLVGVRCEESLNRRRALLGSGTYVIMRRHSSYAKPIFDWHTTDVWQVIKQCHWPYSAYYDKARRLAMSRFATRVAPLGNVASKHRMHLWAQLYPDFWTRVLCRLPELDAMARYGQTRLYSKGTMKPTHLTWQAWTFHLLTLLSPAQARYFRGEIARELRRWERSHSVPYPEEALHDAEGHNLLDSWKRFAYMVANHDSFAGVTRNRM